MLVRLEMDHGHGSGWSPAEIYAFAKAAVGRDHPLVTVDHPYHQNETARVDYEDQGRPRVVSAELMVTCDVGAWRDRQWKKMPALVNAATKTVNANLPATATAYFFNLADQRNLVVSSPFVEVFLKTSKEDAGE